MVKGYYGSASALQSSVQNPAAGDAYGVGAEAPYDIYIYDGVTGAWINNGPLQGAKGEKGDKGDPGAKGETGSTGPTGADGVTPTIGTNGNWYLGETDTGKPSRGEKGDKGDKGNPGAKGEPGETGPKGPTGPQGETGPQGPTGPAGDNGAPGANGVTPTIGENGNWYLGETDTGKPSRGEKGDKGDKGAQGEPGETPIKGTDYFTEADKQEIASQAAGLVDLSGKQNKITASGILKGDGAGGVTAAEAGTDYAAPSLGLTGTAVGQVPAVKTIDEQGQPTQWEATALPNEAFIVYFTLERPLVGDPTITSDRTLEEVIAAITAKKQVIALVDEDHDITQLCNIANATGYLYFYTIKDDGSVVGIGWEIETDMGGEKTSTLTTMAPWNFIGYNGVSGSNQIFGTGELGNYEFKQHISFENLPAVTTYDNGKFMRVKNGGWTAEAISDANGGSF